jgi:hypothetical protein
MALSFAILLFLDCLSEIEAFRVWIKDTDQILWLPLSLW